MPDPIIEAVMALAPALLKIRILPEPLMDALWKADRCGCRMCQEFIKRTMDERFPDAR